MFALDELDSALEAAIGSGDARSLCVLGYGEVTLVLGWPPERPVHAVKRLPPFKTRRDIDCYSALLASYIEALRERGVQVVPTEVGTHAASGGELHVYLVQPIVEAEQLLDTVLRDAPADRGARLIRQVAETVAATVDQEVGLDAQAANWAVEDERLTCFDVSTPMLCGPEGVPRLDLEPFLSLYPAALRPLLRRAARDVMLDFHHPRTVLLDFASNLVKEGLERWVPVTLEAANRVVSPALDERDVQRYFVRDRRFWLLMQWLRRVDRAWQRGVRHRSYGFLLPPPYRYGPPTRWKGHPA